MNMQSESRAHPTTIALHEPVPPELPVGADVGIRVQVSCPEGCDLRGLPVVVAGPDGADAVHLLETFDAPVNETGEFALKAPASVGAHIWSVLFPPHEAAGICHEAGALTIAVATKPRESSMAVWDIPAPVATGDRFTIKVGAKSSAEHPLAGHEIEVCDETGAVTARGRLGETPWPGTSALYWTAVELAAPSAEGLSSWSARFAATDLELPHDGASCAFSFVRVRLPEHSVMVTVVEKATAAPVEDAVVRLGAFRGATDPSGLAEVRVPKGIYDLVVWKVGYAVPAIAVDVNGDFAVRVEADIVPEEDPDARWKA